MKIISCFLVMLAKVFFSVNANAQSYFLDYTISSPQQAYAAHVIDQALIKQGYKLQETNANFTIGLSVSADSIGSEAFYIIKTGKKISITGGDNRGLIYGSFALVEAISNGVRLGKITPMHEQANYLLRAVKFDLPWDTYRHSLALDLHQETGKSLDYWKAFLDMMAENRLNAISLWNLHPYTFMIKPKNFPEASPFTDTEMAEWKALFTGIFKLASERAIDVYIIPFNIFVSPEFSKAHNVNMDNLDHQFFVSGDTSELVKRYTRECVTQMLQEYPEITGMGLTLGEGMGGMSPRQRESWMRETIIEGMRLSGRKLKLVHRIPFSSTTGSLGVTSIETEQLTRKAIEEEGSMTFLQPPIFADLKYNWSHALSTPTLVKVHGGKLYDTYFKPEPTNYKVTWTARNEDIFCLRWGVPDFVRAHIAHNKQSYTGGYFIGSETYIPAKDYFTKQSLKTNWKYAFERQWFYYALWGRLLYNPATPDDIFEAAFTRRYGQAGKPLLKASALAGKTPLRLASLFDFTMDLTLYSEGFMALDNTVKRVEYISIDRLIKQPVTDPDYISVASYVKAKIAGDSFAANKITPPILAGMLERDCHLALDLVKNISTNGNAALKFEVADIKTWSYMGLHFEEKLKAAVALETFRTSGGEANRKLAISHSTKALHYWDEVISITRPLYNNMPLVHYSEQNGVRSKENQSLLFHWQLIRPDVAKDIDIIKKAAVLRN